MFHVHLCPLSLSLALLLLPWGACAGEPGLPSQDQAVGEEVAATGLPADLTSAKPGLWRQIQDTCYESTFAPTFSQLRRVKVEQLNSSGQGDKATAILLTFLQEDQRPARGNWSVCQWLGVYREVPGQTSELIYDRIAAGFGCEDEGISAPLDFAVKPGDPGQPDSLELTLHEVRACGTQQDWSTSTELCVGKSSSALTCRETGRENHCFGDGCPDAECGFDRPCPEGETCFRGTCLTD